MNLRFRHLLLWTFLLLLAGSALAQPPHAQHVRSGARKKSAALGPRRTKKHRAHPHRTASRKRRRPSRSYARAHIRPAAPPDSAFLAAHPGYPADFRPSLMRVDENRLQTFDGDPLRGLRAALGALQRGENRQVRVVHLGDSHLQADMLTGRLRELLQDPAQGGYGAAGRGLVFPYALARTNNPWDYRVTYTGTWLPRRSAIPSHHTNWGLTGLAGATATAGATFTVRLVGVSAVRSPITRVRVFYPLDDSTSYQIYLADSLNFAMYRADPAGGYGEWTLRQPATSVAFRVVQTAATQRRVILQGLSLDNDTPGLVYDMSGSNGATVVSYLRCGRLRRQLTAQQPDLVVLSLGTNDAYGPSFDSVAFRQSYATLVQLVQRAAPGASILLTTPGDTYRAGKPNEARTRTVQRTILELAEQTGCAAWDFFAVMGGGRSIDGWVAAGLAQRDRVHYTLRGYRLQAELLNLALKEALRDVGPVAPPSILAQPK